MSDNEDLLADDLGDHSLADYNLGNDEEDQLLADDFENAQNVPSRPYDQTLPPYEESQSVSYPPEQRESYPEPQSESRVAQEPFVPSEPYQEVDPGYAESYSNGVENECVVPNVPVSEAVGGFEEAVDSYQGPAREQPQPPVPTDITESPVAEPPQLAPEVAAINGEAQPDAARERFPAERPAGATRSPRVRDIPDSLDKVHIPRSAGGQLRGDARTWRNPQYQPRYQQHPYRRVNARHADFQRPPLQPPQARPPPSDFPPHPPNQMPPQRPPFQRPPMQPPPQLPANRGPFARPPNRPPPGFNPPPERFPPPGYGGQPPPPGAFGIDEPPPNFRPIEDRMNFRPPGPNFGPPGFPPERPPMQFNAPPPFQRPQGPNFNRPMAPNFQPRVRLPPPRQVVQNSINVPQVTIRQPVPLIPGLRAPNLPPNLSKDMPPGAEFQPKPEGFAREQEVRMLPVQLPPNIPLLGKKVLINPHFKGNIQPPLEGLTYIPTRIEKPLSPTFEDNFAGPIKNIDDAAERFIAEQRSALARAAHRKPPPPRYVENTTVAIENELAGRERERELLRRQEEFISANRAGLRRRMRSPTPPRRSPTPPRRRALTPPPLSPHPDTSEEGEYKRRLREQESLRERVLRAKEVRRRKNAVTLQRQLQDREREKERERSQVERDQNAPREQRQPERGQNIAEPNQSGAAWEQRPPEREDLYRERPRDAKYYDRDSRLPEREMKQPEREPKQPEREPKQPDRQTKQPERELKQPDRQMKQPEREPKQPDRQTKQPEREQKQPDRQTKQPDREPRVPEREQSTLEALPEREQKLTEREQIPEPERKVPARETERPAIEKTPERTEVPQPLERPATSAGTEKAAVKPQTLEEYERDMTPPLPVPAEGQRQAETEKEEGDEDALDLILEELDGILSDDDDTGRFKEKPNAIVRTETKSKHVDLRSRLPPKETRPAQRQKIVFGNDGKRREEGRRADDGKRRREKTPPKRPSAALSVRASAPASERAEEREPPSKLSRSARPPPPQKQENEGSQARQRQKIIFNKEQAAEPTDETLKPPPAAASRRVVLQRRPQPARPLDRAALARIDAKERRESSAPAAGIFSRAVRTALAASGGRVVVPRREPHVEVESGSEGEGSVDEELLLRDEEPAATVTNLPHGMTDARLRTLAGGDVQSLSLDKERRSAKVTFKSAAAAESFKKKFNNKMVAASRLTVVLR